MIIDLYARISDTKGGENIGVENQLTALREWVASMGHEVGTAYRDDSISAYTGKTRPGFEALLARTEKRPVAVVHLDRLARVSEGLERVLEAGFAVLSKNSGHMDLSSPGGRATARTLVAWSTYETETRVRRQVDRNIRDAAIGKPAWRRRPLGYNLDGTLRQPEASLIAHGYEQVLSGVGLAAIVRGWNDAGMRTPRYERVGGEEVSLSVARKVLLNPRNAAIREYRGERTPGAWEPIVSEAVWLQACQELRRRAALRPHGSGGPESLGGGLYRCGVPGCTSNVRQGRRTSGQRLYVCSGPSVHLGRKADDVDLIVNEYIVTYLGRPEIVELLSESHAPDAARLTAEREDVRTRIAALAHDHHVLGLVGRVDFVNGTQALQARLSQLEAQTLHVDTGSVLGPLLGAHEVREAWEGLSLDRKREVVRILLDVVVEPGRGVPVSVHPREG